MQYDGNKFYLAESDISDALKKINEIIEDMDNCINTAKKEYEFLGELTTLNEQLIDIKTIINDAIDKVIMVRMNLSRLDKTFCEDYMTYYFNNIDNQLDKLETIENVPLSPVEIDEKIYDALKELDATGALNYSLKKNYIISKYPELSDASSDVIDILFDNPNLELKKIQMSNSYYHIYNPETEQNYMIEKDLGTILDSGEFVDEIESIPRVLSSYNKTIYMINGKSKSTDYFRQLYNEPNLEILAQANDQNIWIFDPMLNKSIDELESYYESLYGEIDRSEVPITRLREVYSENGENKISAIGTVYHEMAHNYDMKNSFTHLRREYSVSDSTEWEEAIKQDGKWASDYAKNSYIVRKGKKGQYCEDFAESVKELYLIGPKEFEKQYPNRTKILKERLPELFDVTGK